MSFGAFPAVLVQRGNVVLYTGVARRGRVLHYKRSNRSDGFRHERRVPDYEQSVRMYQTLY